MNGLTTGAYIFTVPITKIVTKVNFMAGSTGKLCDVWFTYFDGSIAKTTICSTCTVGSSVTLTGNLIGLATKSFDGIAFQLSPTAPDLSVWVDNIAECSGCPTFMRFLTTIADRIYVVSQPT